MNRALSTRSLDLRIPRRSRCRSLDGLGDIPRHFPHHYCCSHRASFHGRPYRYHRQRLTTQRAREEQKGQLTSLLHDTIAADLTSVIVQAEKLAITTPQRTDELQELAGTARNALDRTRQLLSTLNTHPSSTPTVSLPIILNNTAQQLRDHGFTVTMTANLPNHINNSINNAALERVLKEAATNIIKHATSG